MNFNDETIEEIYERINKCTKCRLCKNKLPEVKYKWRGNQKAKIFFIGEALGAEEQKTGIPFVGRAGKYLDKLLIEIDINIEKDIFISNIVKCRPPENRDPMYDEILLCQWYLLGEIANVRPKLIVTLGKVSGTWYNHYRPFSINTYYSKKLWLPLYHPSYLTRIHNKVKENEWKNTLTDVINKIGIL